MLHASIDPLAAMSPPLHCRRASVRPPVPSAADMALCREKVRTAAEHTAWRFAAEAGESASPHALRPAFTSADWQVLAGFCLTTRLPAGFPVVRAGSGDRTLRLLVEGCLSQVRAATAGGAGNGASVLGPGAVQGEQAVLADASGDWEVRALEPSLVLELSPSRRQELSAHHPAIGAELQRAAQAVIAACGRRHDAPQARVAPVMPSCGGGPRGGH